MLTQNHAPNIATTKILHVRNRFAPKSYALIASTCCLCLPHDRDNRLYDGGIAVPKRTQVIARSATKSRATPCFAHTPIIRVRSVCMRNARSQSAVVMIDDHLHACALTMHTTSHHVHTFGAVCVWWSDGQECARSLTYLKLVRYLETTAIETGPIIKCAHTCLFSGKR